MIDVWLLIVLVALTTHRLTRLIVEDRVPWVARPREWVQIEAEDRWLRRHNVRENPDEWLSPVAYLLSCMWCLSIYVGGGVVLITDIVIGLPVPAFVWLAASTITGLIGPRSTDDAS